MRVLVVEDEVSLAEVVRRGLTREGFVVDVEHDGEDGLWAATETAYDVIVLDIMLPRLTGYQVVEACSGAEALELAVRRNSDEPVLAYSDRALERVWKAQHFSYWMTTMLHRLPDASDFDVRRQQAELASIAGSTAASTYLAEAYTGWPT